MQKFKWMVVLLGLILSAPVFAGDEKSDQDSCKQNLARAGELLLYPQMSSRNSSRGNFRSVVGTDANGRLSVFLTSDVYRIARQMNLTTLLDFISVAYSFPESLTKPLGWSSVELAQAIEGLRTALAAVGVDLPQDEPSPPVSFGAKRPKRGK